MNYNIFENGELINTIVADAGFVAEYCEKNGYTYEEVTETPTVPTEPNEDETPVTWTELARAYEEGVNSID